MKREPQNDLRYIKTEALIQETFRAMLLEMDYEQVTIKELTERARINRKTFYLHYASLDDLLARMQAGVYEVILQSISGIQLPGELETLVRRLFVFFSQVNAVDEKIVNSHGNFPVGKSPVDNAIKSMFHYTPPKKPLSDSQQLACHMIDAYLTGSITFIYSQWIADGRKMPLENLIELATQLISRGVDILGSWEGSWK